MNSNFDHLRDQIETDENQNDCSKLLTDLFELKKVQKMIELDPKRRVNIGKLIKSVAKCYDCKVSKFDESEKGLSEDDYPENETEEDYYEIEVVHNKIIITDKRLDKKHEINVVEFRNFLENKLDIKSEDNSDNETTITEESKEDKKFHFLKFELILREFYQKKEIRHNLKLNYNTNEVKKVNLEFSYVKQSVLPNSYQIKNNFNASPAIKKNFFEDHKEEIKNINLNQNRRKTMFLENNLIDKLKNDLVHKKIPNTQAPKLNVNLDEIKEEKISSFSSNFEESKENKDRQLKDSFKIAKRTSIFDVKLMHIMDDDEKDSQNCDNSQDN